MLRIQDSWNSWLILFSNWESRFGAGVATTVLLQNFVQHQYKEGRRYQQEIMRELSESTNRNEG